MRLCWWTPVAASAALLSSCGGGGVNSAGSTPITSTPTPTPTNTTLLDLKASQTFGNTAAGVTTAFDLTNKTVISGTGTPETLTISYDAPSQSYTVSTSGRTQTFAPSDVKTTSTGETVYQKTDGTSRDYLTIVKTPYTSPTQPKYVGLGYWQHNVVGGSRQDTQFDTFAYGLPTAASAIPRTGTASFGIDVFGLATNPGFEPRIFEGHGSFSADLLSGLFSTNTYLTESGLLSGDAISGGGIQLQGAGKLGSDGTFAGNMLYGGVNGDVAGTLNGRFYGPSAEEIGAAFVGSNASGATVNGAFTGQRDASVPAVNLAMTNLITSQLFYTQEALLTFTTFDGNAATPQARTTTMISQLNRSTDGSFTYGPGMSTLPGGTFNSASAVASADPNFTSYQQTTNGQTVKLDLYKPGGANTELALTYASFGRWSSSSKNGVVTEADRVYFAYGLETPARLLSAKTGTGHYAGIAYGAGANQTTGALYDVKGTSSFDVNFSQQNYTGALGLKGTSTNGAAAADFGNFTFGGKLAAYTAESAADLMQNGSPLGTLTQRFYGPDGEEIAGPFTVVVPDAAGKGLTAIAGVAVAKRQ